MSINNKTNLSYAFINSKPILNPFLSLSHSSSKCSRLQSLKLSLLPSSSSQSRRHFLQLLSIATVTTSIPSSTFSQQILSPTVTDRVYMDISVAGKSWGRVIMALYGNEAPVSVNTFKNLANGTLKSKSGKAAGYRYSQAARIIADKRIELGLVKQIDSLNQQPGIPQRQSTLVTVPENRDNNQLSHDQSGLVSVKRGGSFQFNILLSSDSTLDDQNLIIGKVIDGMDVIEKLSQVPTNKKTKRDGFRNVGKAIGDARAKVDLEDKPLQKIVITSCGVL